MTFKHHAMGDIKDRPVSEQCEAKFHQLLCPALEKCSNMGNKKKQGYIMGAFREAMADFRVKSLEQALHSIELSREQANVLYNIVSTLQKAHLEAEETAALPEDRKDHRRDAEIMSAIKIKLVVLKLMEHKDDQEG